jgi:hypothetical protein
VPVKPIVEVRVLRARSRYVDRYDDPMTAVHAIAPPQLQQCLRAVYRITVALARDLRHEDPALFIRRYPRVAAAISRAAESVARLLPPARRRTRSTRNGRRATRQAQRK